MALNGGGGEEGSSLVDCSLILEDGPLFSLDSQYESNGDEDEEDEATKCEALPVKGDSRQSSPNDSQSDSADLTTTILTSGQAFPPRPNLENLLPKKATMTAVIESDSPFSASQLQANPHHIDVSSIYLHSPEELLEENFEEALREQYLASLPPLDPALDLTPSGLPNTEVGTEGGGTEVSENFEDIAEHGIVGVAGDDMFARKVITIYACRLPASKTFNYAKFLR